MLFIAEPLFLHRWFLAGAKAAPDSTFRLVQWLHWVGGYRDKVARCAARRLVPPSA
jgi:hypothetical protein